MVDAIVAGAPTGPGEAGRGSAADAVQAARRRRMAVVSTGFCGGLDPALRIGDYSWWPLRSSGADYVAYPSTVGPHRAGTGRSIDHVAHDGGREAQSAMDRARRPWRWRRRESAEAPRSWQRSVLTACAR